MKTFTKNNLNELRTDINAALAIVASKHELTRLAIGRITFTDTTMRSTVEGATGNAGDDRILGEKMRMYGFKPELLGATVTLGNKQYTVRSMKRTNFVADGADGKSYKLPFDIIPAEYRLL